MKDEQPRRDPLFSIRLMVGLWIIALGAVFLAGNLGWIDARKAIGLFWPFVFVAVGTGMLSQTTGRTHRWGWVFIGVGIWLFANKIGWINVSLLKLAFPLALLGVGGLLVWRAFHAPSGDAVVQESVSEDHAEFLRFFAVMSGTELRPVSRPFRGADLSAVMAGIKLDLSDARMEGDTATIEVFAFWGGVEIHVPRDWTVTSKVANLMGGFTDKRRPTTSVATKNLVITGFIVMSGIEVKN